MTEKTLAERKFIDWGFIITHAAANLPRWYNPITRRLELTTESTERLDRIVDDTKHMVDLYGKELAENAIEKYIKKHGTE